MTASTLIYIVCTFSSIGILLCFFCMWLMVQTHKLNKQNKRL